MTVSQGPQPCTWTAQKLKTRKMQCSIFGLPGHEYEPVGVDGDLLSADEEDDIRGVVVLREALEVLQELGDSAEALVTRHQAARHSSTHHLQKHQTVKGGWWWQVKHTE